MFSLSRNILTLCFPWKLFSNRSLAETPWQAAPLALPAVAVTQPGRPYFAWYTSRYISPVSVDALCCEGQNSCSHVIEIIHCRCQDAGWLQNPCKPKNIAGNKSLRVGGQKTLQFMDAAKIRGNPWNEKPFERSAPKEKKHLGYGLEARTPPELSAHHTVFFTGKPQKHSPGGAKWMGAPSFLLLFSCKRPGSGGRQTMHSQDSLGHFSVPCL